MISDLISLIFPQNCINCHSSLLHSEQFLCISCKLDLPITDDHLHENNPLFKKFVFEPKVLSASAFLYFNKGGVTQKLLHELKYKGKKEIGVFLGLLYGDKLTNLQIDAIIPVPLHIRKRQRRGYNQSECFANGLAQIIQVEVHSDTIVRRVSTATQTKKNKIERWLNLENIYSEVSYDYQGMNVLVVDDVITSGATIGMMCVRLVEAGVAGIHIATIARGK